MATASDVIYAKDKRTGVIESFDLERLAALADDPHFDASNYDVLDIGGNVVTCSSCGAQRVRPHEETGHDLTAAVRKAKRKGK